MCSKDKEETKHKLSLLDEGGNIPAGTECPFWKKCGFIAPICPVPGKVNDVPLSCGAARAFDLMVR